MFYSVKTIGHATLYLGDCLEVLADIRESIDMVFTDPPYGHNNNNGDLISKMEHALGRHEAKNKAQNRPIANDGAQDAARVFTGMLEAIQPILGRGCVCCCGGGGGGPDPQFARWALEMDRLFAFKQAVVWDKGPMGMGWHYRRSYEFVLVAEGKGKPRWYDKTNKIENIIRPGQYGIKKIIPSKEDHPTPKPPELAQHFIRLHTEPGDIVLDPFMGAGSTGIAALREGRRFIGIELEPRWYEMACRDIDAGTRQIGFSFG